jgi:hypothetical protein
MKPTPALTPSPCLVKALLVAMLILISFLLVRMAFAHGPEQWIADKLLRDPVSGAFCCGEFDCSPLPAENVHEVQGGYSVTVGPWYGHAQVTEVVPYSRALPKAPDGQYHACVVWSLATPKIRCLIVPPGSS